MAKGDGGPGFLTNGDLIRYKLPRAKLVVLSACRSAVEDYYSGEGPIGLSRTFLAVGVPVVVASLWPVDSDATGELMKRFHFLRRSQKLSTAETLRRAQLEFVNDSGSARRQPYFWSAFAAFGGFTRF